MFIVSVRICGVMAGGKKARADWPAGALGSQSAGSCLAGLDLKRWSGACPAFLPIFTKTETLSPTNTPTETTNKVRRLFVDR